MSTNKVLMGSLLRENASRVVQRNNNRSAAALTLPRPIAKARDRWVGRFGGSSFEQCSESCVQMIRALGELVRTVLTVTGLGVS